jgi:hypothetical protein
VSDNADRNWRQTGLHVPNCCPKSVRIMRRQRQSTNADTNRRQIGDSVSNCYQKSVRIMWTPKQSAWPGVIAETNRITLCLADWCKLWLDTFGDRWTPTETLGDKLETVGDGWRRSETLRGNLVSSRGRPNLGRVVDPLILISNSWSALSRYPGNQISWYLKQMKIAGIAWGTLK